MRDQRTSFSISSLVKLLVFSLFIFTVIVSFSGCAQEDAPYSEGPDGPPSVEGPTANPPS